MYKEMQLDSINLNKDREECENRTAFAVYLGGAPEIKNATDQNQCSGAREYFGFNMNFVNDKQICGDIRQFQNARSFDFLEEFFAQGFDGEPEVDDFHNGLLDE